MVIPARITGLESTRERLARQMGRPITQNHADVADLLDAAVREYGNREVGYDKRCRQDGYALHHLLVALGQYVRDGGDPAVLSPVIASLDFAANH